MSDVTPETPARSLTAQPLSPVQDVSETYTQNAQGRITAFPFAVGLILLGSLLLIETQITGFDVTLPIAILILVASLVLTYLFRFFVSGRQERGLFFLALLTLTFGGVLALMTALGDTFEATKWYPLVLLGTALALFITYLADREHERGLLGLTLLMLLAGIAGLCVTLEVIPAHILDDVADYFPLIIAFIGITLIPLALRRSTE